MKSIDRQTLKKAEQLLKSDMYQKGYDNAAIGFAYIPDFNGKEDSNEFSRGYKDGKKAIKRMMWEA